MEQFPSSIALKSNGVAADDGVAPPVALAESGLIIASAPLRHHTMGGAVVPLAEYTPRQGLFGWEAQLGAFASALARCGRAVFLLPAPEIFSTPESRAHIARATGWDEHGTLTHLRFGMPYFARVVKGADNVMVLAEHRLTRPLTPTYHPFGGGNRVPAAMARLLVYQRQRFLPRRSDGSAIPDEILDARFAVADLSPPPSGQAAIPLRGSDASGLIVRSFAEFDPTAWREAAPRAGAGPALLDWRGVIALRAVARERGAAVPPLVMMPWNLAHPASIVADLVEKLARSGGLAETGFRLVLFPYNETEDNIGQISALTESARRLLHATPADLRHLFIARLTQRATAMALASLFEIVWLEAAAPDRLWTERRLAALGLPAALLAVAPDDDESTPDAPLRHRFTLAADEEKLITTDDQFGERLYTVGTLSARDLARLLQRTLEDAPAPPALAPSPPALSSITAKKPAITAKKPAITAKKTNPADATPPSRPQHPEKAAEPPGRHVVKSAPLAAPAARSTAAPRRIRP